jgi:glycosyltransferase involved in cell wall biosynthesis
MNVLPSVSTIVPVYNAERTIAQTIDSALAQDYADHEIIVVNDGSTDSTATILEKYSSQIQVVTQPNGGLSVARNAGVRHSTGKYIALLDSDDIWLPKKLKIMVPALGLCPSASLAFSECRFIDENGMESGESSLGRAPSLDEILTPQPLSILPSTWLLRRESLQRIGGFCEKFKGAGGFDDIWLLMLLRELGQFVYISDRLTLYRSVHSGTTADKYRSGMYVFLSLLKERYGAGSKRWIRNTKNAQCKAMLSKVADQMNNGDRPGALRTLAAILCFRPVYFLGADFRRRMFLPQNVKRLRTLTSVLSRAHE